MILGVKKLDLLICCDKKEIWADEAVFKITFRKLENLTLEMVFKIKNKNKNK